MKKLSEKVLFFGFLYPFVGCFLGGVFRLFRSIGVIKVENIERLLPQENGLILACNHPSRLDPGLAPFLFFPGYLKHPIRLIPWCTPDKNEYYTKWWFWFFRPISIPIDRADTGKSQAAAAVKMLKILKRGGIIILFVEATRTFKAERNNNVVYSNGGKALGRLKEGASFLAIASEATIVPAWFEGTDSIWQNEKLSFPDLRKLPVKIRIGQPMSFSRKNSLGEVNQEITQALLELADQ